MSSKTTGITATVSAPGKAASRLPESSRLVKTNGSRSTKVFTYCAVAAALLALLLTPIQSFVWNDDASPPLVRALGPLHEAADGFAHVINSNADLYYFYGRFFVFVYLGALGGLAVMGRRMLDATPTERLSMRTVMVCVGLAGALDVAAYSGTASNLPFIAEMVVVLVSLVAVSVLGGASLRAGRHPRWVGLALCATIPAALLCATLTQYLPHAAVLPLATVVALITVGDRPRTGES